VVRDFYLRSRACQALVAAIFAGSGAALISGLLLAAPLAAFVAALPVLVSLAQFSLTPALRFFGVHQYYSTTLKVTMRAGRYLEIHGGAVFDYLLAVRWAERGPVAARKIMVSYLEGLLGLAEEVERGRLPRDIEIVGASYFFHAATARRLGCRVQPAPWWLRANLWLHVLDVVALYSFSKGRLALPDLSHVTTAVIRGDELLARLDDIHGLLRLLRREPQPEGFTEMACA
jgi:hypothetical protein